MRRLTLGYAYALEHLNLFSCEEHMIEDLGTVCIPDIFVAF